MQLIHKILLLSVSAGAGHVRAAEAIEAYAKQYSEGKVKVEVLHLDVMDYVPQTFRKIYIDTYIKLVQKVPAVWGAIYKKTDQANPSGLSQKMRRIVERLNTKKLLKAVTTFNPDAVICTHFLPAEILMHEVAKERFSAPVWVQVTDFDLHKMWVMPHMQGYFVANDEVAYRLKSNGINEAEIHVSGIPIMSVFNRDFNKSALLKNYELTEQTPTVLLMGGGAGLGGLDKVAKNLLEQIPGFQLVVLAGRNEKSLKLLQTLAQEYPNRLFPQGFTNKVEELMACADLVVTKPGGLTSSECLAMGLPMIVHAPIPGQEEHNADYLLEQGVALKALDEVGLIFRVERLIKNLAQLENMQQQALKIAQPHAAKKVFEEVLAHLDS